MLEVNGNIKAIAVLYSSDRRLKEDVQELISPLDTILNLHGVNFRWKENKSRDVGFIAQEVEEVLPDVVHTSATTGLKSVKYGNIVAMVVEAVKEMYHNFNSRLEKLEKLFNHENGSVRVACLAKDGRSIASVSIVGNENRGSLNWKNEMPASCEVSFDNKFKTTPFCIASINSEKAINGNVGVLSVVKGKLNIFINTAANSGVTYQCMP
jgi:hypothetical protein